jgi:CubicO group peptidase (beta-lactamase class C family)
MCILKKLPLVCCMLILTVIAIDAQQKELSFKDYDARVRKWLIYSRVPAVGIGIIEDGKLRQIMVYGDLKKGDPAPYNSIFQVASLTKPVTAMVTLKLASMGKWNLDEPLSHYWVDPDVLNDPRHLLLTTRHVLSHQTGFDNWRWNNKSKKLVFNFDPGTKFGYSGEGFEYLKHALENKFKMALDRLADSLLFKPLEMTDTRYIWDDKIDSGRYAVPHDTSGTELEIPKNSRASAADFLKTTIEDYCKFGVAVINGTGLTKGVFNEMVTPQVKIGKYESFGLGWDIMTNLSNGEYILFHTGSDAGTRTAVILFPQSRKGIVIFTNGDNGNKLIELIVLEYLDLGNEILQKLDSN